VRTVPPPTVSQLRAAADVVRRHLPPSPVVPAPLLGPRVWLKLESLQPTGAFKVRGGLAAVAAAQAADPGTALVTASAGNHGLGLAFAADRLGVDATVVVAETASAAKVAALERFAVTLVRHGQTYDEAEAHAMALADAKGGRYVSPYNDPDVIAGQATVGSELVTQVAGLATVVVPVGGGGLLSGVGLGTERVAPRIVGVEPDVSTAMAAAQAAGHVVRVTVGPTMADGLAGNLEEGSVTVELVHRFADFLCTVTEAEIAAAVRFLAFEHGLVAEGSGAVGVAAVMTGRVAVGDEATAVVVSGRNIAQELLVSILSG
jgi:threonine dehydratase